MYCLPALHFECLCLLPCVFCSVQYGAVCKSKREGGICWASRGIRSVTQCFSYSRFHEPFAMSGALAWRVEKSLIKVLLFVWREMVRVRVPPRLALPFVLASSASIIILCIRIWFIWPQVSNSSGIGHPFPINTLKK